VQEDTLKKLEDRETTRSAVSIDALKQALSEDLAQLQRSVTEGKEVQRKALQQLAAKVDTSMPSELHRELEHIRQELQIVRTVQNNALYGVYDVPLLPIIVHYADKCLLDAVKGLAYETWTLHFACPVCAQPAPSGPKEKGYKLEATRAWVQRVNKAVALGLKALSVISLVTPLPLPGLGMLADFLPTGSFDKLTEDAENRLKTAQEGLEKMQEGLQKLEDAANTSADTMQQLSAANSELRPVVVDFDYVQTIREILLALKETPPGLQYTGLVRAICGDKGECAWVCKTGACKAQFEQEGVACQRIRMEFA
jgi:hypothetical protein